MKDDSNQIRRSETRSTDYLYEHLKKALGKAETPHGVGKASSVSNAVGKDGAVDGMPMMLSGTVIPLNLLGGE
jgi:hypothetical protein